ncbi:ZP3 protein, partial [Polypterus senegalus]
MGIIRHWVVLLIILAGVVRCLKYHGRISDPQAVDKRVVKPLGLQKTVQFSDFGRGRGIAFKAQPAPQGARSAVLNTVTVDCGESNMVVFVIPDIFGKGILVNANDLRLGPSAVPPCLPVANATGFVITAGLQDCGSSLAMMTDAMVYTNQLIYAPSPLPSGIIRTNGAVIPIECTYERQKNVSSNAFQPTWVPFTSTIAAGSNLEFSLQLMSADWSSSVPPTVYYLDDMVNIQASVISMEKTPVMLFVDSCVATLSPDASSAPRYMVIDFSGHKFAADFHLEKPSLPWRDILLADECYSYCQPSQGKVRMNLKTYCQTDYVLKAQVQVMERSGPWWRFSVSVQQVFRRGTQQVRKGIQSIWVPERDLSCGCPALQVGKTFLIIGSQVGPDKKRIIADHTSVALPWRDHWNPKLRVFRTQDRRGHCKMLLYQNPRPRSTEQPNSAEGNGGPKKG